MTLTYPSFKLYQLNNDWIPSCDPFLGTFWLSVESRTEKLATTSNLLATRSKIRGNPVQKGRASNKTVILFLFGSRSDPKMALPAPAAGGFKLKNINGGTYSPGRMYAIEKKSRRYDGLCRSATGDVSY